MKPSQTHYPSFLVFLLSAVAALLAFALGFILGLAAFFDYRSFGGVDARATISSFTLLFVGCLLGIVSVVSLFRFLNMPAANRPMFTSFHNWQIAAGIGGAVIILLFGYFVQDNQSVNWLALPLLTIPAVLLPIWALTALATKNLSLGSLWRAWSAYGISLTVTPFLLVTLEIMALVAILVFFGFYAVANPDVAAELEKLSTQFAILEVNSEEALNLLAPYLTRPGVVIPLVLLFCVFIPLVEELIKPLAVWLLVRRLDSASQGFALGALSGAGFALVETLGISRQAPDWGSVLFTRIGTGLLHITTSALVGAAIYAAIRERRHLRLLGIYLFAALLHGAWNASALAVSFSAIVASSNGAQSFTPLQWISTFALIFMACTLLALLIRSNRRHRQTSLAAPLVESSSSPLKTSR